MKFSSASFFTLVASVGAAGNSSYVFSQKPSAVVEPGAFQPAKTLYTTYCSGHTMLTTNGGTYTVTKATTLNITNCPCTVTHSSSAAARKVPANDEELNNSQFVAPSEPTTTVIPRAQDAALQGSQCTVHSDTTITQTTTAITMLTKTLTSSRPGMNFTGNFSYTAVPSSENSILSGALVTKLSAPAALTISAIGINQISNAFAASSSGSLRETGSRITASGSPGPSSKARGAEAPYGFAASSALANGAAQLSVGLAAGAAAFAFLI